MMPEHIGRLRASGDVVSGLASDTSIIWASKTSEVQPFDYLLQTGSPLAPGRVFRGRAREPIDLTLAVNKSLADGVFSVQAWGRNLLAKDQIESFDAYAFLGHPHAVSRSFGLSVSANPRW